MPSWISFTQSLRALISFLKAFLYWEFCIVPSTRSIPAATQPLPVLQSPRSWKSLQRTGIVSANIHEVQSWSYSRAIDNMHPEPCLFIPQIVSIIRNLIVSHPKQGCIFRQDAIIRKERRDHIHEVAPQLHLANAMTERAVLRPWDFREEEIELALTR